MTIGAASSSLLVPLSTIERATNPHLKTWTISLEYVFTLPLELEPETYSWDYHGKRTRYLHADLLTKCFDSLGVSFVKPSPSITVAVRCTRVESNLSPRHKRRSDRELESVYSKVAKDLLRAKVAKKGGNGSSNGRKRRGRGGKVFARIFQRKQDGSRMPLPSRMDFHSKVFLP